MAFLKENEEEELQQGQPQAVGSNGGVMGGNAYNPDQAGNAAPKEAKTSSGFVNLEKYLSDDTFAKDYVAKRAGELATQGKTSADNVLRDTNKNISDNQASSATGRINLNENDSYVKALGAGYKGPNSLTDIQSYGENASNIANKKSEIEKLNNSDTILGHIRDDAYKTGSGYTSGAASLDSIFVNKDKPHFEQITKSSADELTDYLSGIEASANQRIADEKDRFSREKQRVRNQAIAEQLAINAGITSRAEANLGGKSGDLNDYGNAITHTELNRMLELDRIIQSLGGKSIVATTQAQAAKKAADENRGEASNPEIEDEELAKEALRKKVQSQQGG